MDELFAGSDAVSLHLALTEKTRGIVTKQLLSIAKPTCILVNTARGALIDEQALVDGLEQGRIAHAALDVFVNEPLPANSPLLRLENVTLTAHAAWNTPKASRRCLEAGLRLLRDAPSDR